MIILWDIRDQNIVKCCPNLVRNPKIVYFITTKCYKYSENICVSAS